MTISPPTTAEQVSKWILVLSVCYIGVRMLFAWRRKSSVDVGIAIISDALLFAGSVLVILGIWYHAVLLAIGDLTVYLVMAGLAGISVTLRSAWREGLPPPSKETSASAGIESLLSEDVVAKIVAVVRSADQAEP